MKNPIMSASGTYDYGIHEMEIYDTGALGAVVLKSVCFDKRPGNPMPRIYELPYGMLNAVGIPSTALPEYVETILPRYQNYPAPVIFSIVGRSPKDYFDSVKLLADNPHIAALELNLSCPNIGSGLPFSANENILRETLGPLSGMTDIPIFAKLSPISSNIVDVAKAAEDCGMTAVTLTNTFPGMVIDIEKQRPVLGNKGGGVSGPCIKPLVMQIVYNVYSAINIPIIACGGVSSASDAIEYLLAGATAVQVGSASFHNPLTMLEAIDGIHDYLCKYGYDSVRELIGLSHK